MRITLREIAAVAELSVNTASRALIRDGRARFMLPGENGQIDYVKLLKLLVQGGYRGTVCCEVSGKVSSQKGYDPVAAARTCYENIARALARVGRLHTPG